MIERAVDENRGAFIDFAGEVGERFVSSDCLFDRGIHRSEQRAVVIRARQPLNQAVIVFCKRGQLPREKRVYIFLPAWRGNGGHLSHSFTRSRRRRRGWCLNGCSYGQPQFRFRTFSARSLWKTNGHARIASFALLSNHRNVFRSPSRKGVFARQPNSARAREVSRQRRGWPSGFVASHRNAPS